jgi:hypothetical protein
MSLSKLLENVREAGRRARRWALWLLAAEVTSLKGVLDRSDVRPALAKAIVLAMTAAAGIQAALKDPEVMGAAAILLIAVLSGLLEAISRANQGGAPAPGSNAGSLPAEPPMTGETPHDAKHDP